MSASRLRTGLRLLALALLGIGGLMAVGGAVLGYPPYRQMKTWPTTEAEVIRAEVFATPSTGPRGGSATVYGTRYLFRYTVNGVPFKSSADVGYRSSSPTTMASWVSWLPRGSKRLIRYDPAHPTEISLAIGYDQLSFAGPVLLFKVTLIACGIGLMLLLGLILTR